MDQTDEQFLLEDDESYEKVAGEILLTSKGKFALQCTMCGATYRDLEMYISHFMEQHMKNTEPFEDKPIIENEAFLYDTDDETKEDETTTIKMEIVPLEIEEFIEENEKEVISLYEESKIQKSTSENSKNSDDLVIPSVIRNVLKRNPVMRKTAPIEQLKHKCPICGQGFKEKHNMHYHFKRHSVQKDHACPECGKMFYTRSEVRSHLRFHSTVRAFLCSDCGRSFRTSFLLTNHAKRHRNQRDYKCKLCDKAFFDNETLQSHIRVHTSERPFKCKICDTSFSRKTALRNHVKLHENKREYKCNLCDAGFNQQAGLFSHMKITHKAA